MSLLAATPYIGRAVFQAMNLDGNAIFHGALFTGRSEPSLNRIYVKDFDGIRTVRPGASDEEMAEDPFRYYHVMKAVGGVHVVSNGAQTEPITWNLLKGQNLIAALKNAPSVPESIGSFEEIPLNSYELDRYFTPRVSASSDLRSPFIRRHHRSSPDGSNSMAIVSRLSASGPPTVFFTLLWKEQPEWRYYINITYDERTYPEVPFACKELRMALSIKA